MWFLSLSIGTDPADLWIRCHCCNATLEGKLKDIWQHLLSQHHKNQVARSIFKPDPKNWDERVLPCVITSKNLQSKYKGYSRKIGKDKLYLDLQWRIVDVLMRGKMNLFDFKERLYSFINSLRQEMWILNPNDLREFKEILYIIFFYMLVFVRIAEINSSKDTVSINHESLIKLLTWDRVITLSYEGLQTMQDFSCPILNDRIKNSLVSFTENKKTYHIVTYEIKKERLLEEYGYTNGEIEELLELWQNGKVDKNFQNPSVSKP